MTDNLIIEKAIGEIQSQRFGTTEQILEVHEVVYVDDKPQVLRVDTENDDGTAYIQVATVFHNGNTMLGGHHPDKDIIKRLAALNLELDFDLYAE